MMPGGKPDLPTELTLFIGREQELGAIEQRLQEASCRLLTLVGPGGIGKTRLALEALRRLHGRYPHGTLWVDLQPVPSADLLATAVADALGPAQSGSGSDTALLDALETRTMLIALDNFEHLRAGVGLVAEILHRAPGVQILITSRQALHLRGEWILPVAGLPVPPATERMWQQAETYDAVRLFVSHVSRVRSNFQPQAEIDGILQVCRLVEGMPLALELAAAWARALDAASIAAEIRRSLDFLTADTYDLPDRQRSLQSIFDHTWSQLSPAEQSAYCQMAVFRGGFRREAAAYVAGATLPMLTSLVDRSLLRWDANGRYQMHTLLQQYATARGADYPDQIATAVARHAAYFLQFLHARTDRVLGEHQQAASREIAAELDNIRLAWDWAIEHDQAALIDQALDAMDMACQLQSRFLEGQRRLAQASQLPAEGYPTADLLRARALNCLGWFHIRLGQFTAAEAAFHHCQSIYEAQALLPPAGHSTDPRLGLSSLAAIRGAYATSVALAEAALATAVAQANAWNVAAANYLLAETARARGAYNLARQYASAAYAATEQTQDRWFMAYCLYEMGQATLALGDFARARQHMLACFALREAFADPEGMALATNSLGEIAYRQGQFDEAQTHFERSLEIYRDINDRGGLATTYRGLGRTAVAHRQPNGARQALQRALQIASDIQFVTLQLTILVDVGDFLLRTGRVQPGISLLRLVQNHPAATEETQRHARTLLNHYKTAVSPALRDAESPADDLEAAVALAATELLVHVPHTAVAPLPDPPAYPGDLVEPLTDRELEVLRLLAQGRTNRQIADALSVVVGTVKAHNNRIYGKLGVSSRTQAVARARELGLIP